MLVSYVVKPYKGVTVKATVVDQNVAYPRTINLGARDLSQGTLPIENAPLTFHVPLIYIFSDKGMTRKLFATAGEVFSVFGQEFANERSRYFNHPSTLFNVLRDTNLGGGATFAIKRLIPSDATVKANVRMYLDVLKTKVPNYKRNSDGSYALKDGKKQLDEKQPCIDGVMVRWSTKSDKEKNLPSLGAKEETDGTILAWKMEDGANNVNIHTTAELAKKLTKDAVGKTVYLYADEDAMFNPVKGTTQRTIHKLVADGVDGVKEDDNTPATTETFGGANTEARSKSYPMFEAIAAELGSGYNNVGFGIQNVTRSDLKEKHIRQSLHIPYKFFLYNRKNASSKPEVIDTLSYNQSVIGTLKVNDYDPDTDKSMDIAEVFPHEFYNETNRNKALRYIELDEFNIYRKNIELVLKEIFDLEKTHITTDVKNWEDGTGSDTFSWTDFIKDPDIPLEDQINMLNIMSFKYSNGVPLQTVYVANSRLPENMENVERDMSVLSPIFMANGQDGTLSNTEFEEAIVRDMKRYADIGDPEYQNLGTNAETIIYDTGFTMETKQELYKFIQERKGTSVVLSTHVDGENPKSYDHNLHLTRGQKIKNSLTLNPESETYGTPAARACVFCGYGRLPNKGRKYYPLTIELACKLNRYVGPASGIWDDRRIISEPGNKIFSIMYDIQPRDLGHGQMKALNDAGVNYPLTGSENKPFIPALMSVYNDATSSLYSFITVQALTVLDKVQYKVWERFVGIGGKMTNEELITQIQMYANTLVSGVTGNSIDIVVRAEMRDADIARGFSWALIGEVRVGTMKTLQVYHTEVMRIEQKK